MFRAVQRSLSLTASSKYAPAPAQRRERAVPARATRYLRCRREPLRDSVYAVAGGG